ncbi:MAG: hypothetical protein ABMA64_21275 [Myxococcota bacterium]
MIVWISAACTQPPGAVDGPTPIYDPQGSGFFDTPWPADDRRDADGTIALADFPNPYAVSLVSTYLEIGEALPGFGQSSPVYLRFDGPFDPTTLPTPSESMAAGSPLVLVDVDPDSPYRGQRFPVQWEQNAYDGSGYMPLDLLAVAPMYGWPLRGGTKHALVVSTAIAKPSATWAARPLDPDLEAVLPTLDLEPDEVAIATVFTTQDPVAEMADLAWFVQNAVGGPNFDVVMEHLYDHDAYQAWSTHYPSPVFTHGEPPYLTEGGEFRWDASGRPEIARFDDLRLAVCTPVGLPEPASGWPVVIVQHGTGGDYRGFCDSDALLETANQLGLKGLVGVGIDQPLHGDRPGAESASDLAHFNIINPVSASTNFRQGAIDAIYLARALARQPWTFSTTEGYQFRTDPERIMFFGHSQGGLTGALAAPFWAGDVKATMLSGAGGVLAITVVERIDPLDFGALVRELLLLGDDEPLTPLHPTLGLVQTLVEVTDPVNYAPYWSAEPGAWPNHLPGPVLLTSGTADAATPYETAVALAAAGRLPQVGTPATRCEAVRMRTGAPRALPQAGNSVGFDGSVHTSGFSQYLDGTHFVVYEEQAAADLVFNWFASTAAGEPALWSD